MNWTRAQTIIEDGFAKLQMPLTDQQKIVLAGTLAVLLAKPTKVWVAVVDSDSENTTRVFAEEAKAFEHLCASLKDYFPDRQAGWMKEAIAELRKSGTLHAHCGSCWTYYEQDIE